MLSLNIKPNGTTNYHRTYWPQPLVQLGFVGDLEALNDSVTVVVIHPTACLEHVRKSLELHLAAIQLRIEQETAGK